MPSQRRHARNVAQQVAGSTDLLRSTRDEGVAVPGEHLRVTQFPCARYVASGALIAEAPVQEEIPGHQADGTGAIQPEDEGSSADAMRTGVTARGRALLPWSSVRARDTRCTDEAQPACRRIRSQS